ncbi:MULTISPECIES: dTDP-4-dehydrorhamnose 3,5-epimerase [Pectobacterium]|uniref:dTDP-4-dehydrorhamnose 3,5-epimerase n=1 Tax=Pectobacterium parvum TaxID=2778550 RepID=A0ABW8G2H6_9GAMM|nr:MULTISPECIES: dTDP-4-dehydrorhamnose 3,5-epimerase [Pectobacterium]KFX17202.1 dTDP-4-dehydrorhamnose 3,5-epimerase [Pectobacterium parvum]KHT14076.1 dTDP-4-dehydrorhamnose 3,5-epimerase [Pectobacterium carotovorum subsp. carotovorum]MBA0178174.1 dTDP-4-dehydrorhamnose 3,5-epimerase [Pectobacterium carotovorum]MCA6965382.1 dTDP-4-dehydrorhamnose 3,5-epimerase [Pectobacterium carotovorum]MCH4987806.1 dTDP-4-dehydrorhamnose 3,5-epimerase [Pectobacterium carotovorum]
MQVKDTRIEGVKIIQPKVFGDDRGFFLETFEKKRYQEMLNINLDFVQDNHSRSSKGVLRGLHFQRSNPQGKLVRVVRGEVFDVAVDIRPDSPTYGAWEGVILSEENKTQFWIPPGLAHGFVVLSDVADFEYKCTDYYNPANEGCLLWNDPDVGIEWPVTSPLLSEKDKLGRLFKELGE